MITYSLVRKNKLPSLYKTFDDTIDRYISNSRDVFEIMEEKGICDLPEEYVYLFSLNCRGRIVGFFEISHGDVSESIIPIPQIIIRILLSGGRRAVLVHNHPSGDISPSKCDISVTKSLSDACELVGLEMLDHIIITERHYLSLKEAGYLNKEEK